MQKALKKEISIVTGITLVTVLVLVIGQQFGFDPFSGSGLRGFMGSMTSTSVSTSMPPPPPPATAASTSACNNGMCNCDAICQAIDYTPSGCGADCGSSGCGNGICEAAETPTTCPVDCPLPPPGSCGNFICEAGETVSCPGDCTGCRLNGTSCSLNSQCCSTYCNSINQCAPFIPIACSPSTVSQTYNIPFVYSGCVSSVGLNSTQYLNAVKSVAAAVAQTMCDAQLMPNCPAGCVQTLSGATFTITPVINGFKPLPNNPPPPDCTAASPRKGQWKGTCTVTAPCTQIPPGI